MKFKRDISALNVIDKGIIIPQGTQYISIGYDTSHLLTIREDAEKIEELFTSAGIKLSERSSLGKLISMAKRVADKWMLNKSHLIPVYEQVEITHFTRVVDSILLLEPNPDHYEHLKRLASESLEITVPGRSQAKSILWELDLWSTFKKRGAHVYLKDPPDLILELSRANIAIPCKKLFSEKHVQNVLSQAVKQIKTTNLPGLVAFNIDDISCAQKVYCGKHPQEATEELNKLNLHFLSRHRHHFEKYLAQERIIGALVSTGCVCDLSEEQNNLQYVRQNTIWCLPNISETTEKLLSDIQKCLM